MAVPRACNRDLPTSLKWTWPDIPPNCKAVATTLLWNDTAQAWRTVISNYKGYTILGVLTIADITGTTADFTLKVYDQSTPNQQTLLDTMTQMGINCCPSNLTMSFTCETFNRYVGCAATSGPTMTVKE